MAFSLFQTAFGTCGIAWEGDKLTGFQLPGPTDERTRARLAPGEGTGVAEGDAPEWVCGIISRVRRHLAGDLQDFTGLRLDWSRVSEFQRAVYVQTQAIRPGSKSSYGEVARAVALGPESARAVGVALATNPWPLLVPCHRVVSADGKMTGFSAPGGVLTKTRLLALEGAELLSE
jgi:methylated-DNA-[protein]-cysteine S-methyltransferase